MRPRKFPFGLLILFCLPIASAHDTWASQRGSATSRSVSGIVREAARRQPLQADILVAEKTATGRAVRTVRTDSNGRYDVAIASGEVSVVAKSEGYSSVYFVVPDGAGPLVHKDFELERPATIAGTVVDSTGTPVSDAAVRVAYVRKDTAFQLASDLGETRSAADGRFLLTGIAPFQQFAVEAQSVLHPVMFSNVMSAGAAESLTGVTLVLTKGSRFAVRIVDEVTATAIQGADVIVVNDRGRRASQAAENSVGMLQANNRHTKTDERGVADFAGLPEGELRITVIGPGYTAHSQVVTISKSPGEQAIEVRLKKR